MSLFARKAIPTDHPDRPQEWITKAAPSIPKTRPKSLAEFFSILSNLPAQQEQIDFLRLNQTPPLLTFLRAILDENIAWFVDAETGYEPSTEAESFEIGWQTLRRCYLWCDLPEKPSPLKSLEPAKRNRKWSNFLSEHTKAEAEVWKSAARKTLPFDVDPVVIILAFPNLLNPAPNEFQRMEERRLAEMELVKALAEQNRINRVVSEPSVLEDLLEAKRNLQSAADQRVRAAQARLSALLGMRTV